MNSNASVQHVASDLLDVDLRHHFVLLAEDANRLGDQHLAQHFLEIAMEMFDAAPQASSGTETHKLSTRQPAVQYVV